MSKAQIIDGKALSTQTRKQIAERAAALRAQGFVPRLDAVLVGAGDTAARQYADSQARSCHDLGIDYVLHDIDPDRTITGDQREPLKTSADIFDAISKRVLLLNSKEDVAAVMVHMPMPDGIDSYAIQSLIHPEKDVEGVNPANIGNVLYGRSSLAPCTALAVMKLLEMTKVELRGKMCVVVGASNHVGKPIAVLLMRRDATVVSCNKWTPDLPSLTRAADVVVAAAGVPGLIKREMVKPGAIVIDVGVNRVHDELHPERMRTVGDVDFEAVSHVASWITPVPGGVGPMTVTTLLLNVIDACERAAGKLPR